jgi:hypothetical protein
VATDTRNPASDVAITGTWTGTASNRWTLVDNHPDASATDKITCSAAGTAVFGFTPAFSIPAGSTSISVQVLYYDSKNGSQSCSCGALIRCNDTTNRLATAHNPANATFTSRSDNYANNPKTSTGWTVNDVNGVGTNGLTAFGLSVTDASPTIDLASIQLQVTYTPPSFTGTSGGTVEAVSGAASGTLGYSGTSAGTLSAVTGGASGTSVGGAVTGTSSGALSAITGTASGQVDPPVSGTSVGTLSAATGSASGKLGYSGTSVGTLSVVTGTASGTLGYSGSSTGSLASLTGSVSGKNGFNGTSAGNVAAITGTSAGKLGYSGTSVGTVSAVTGSGAALTGDGVLGTSAGTLGVLSGSGSGYLSYSGTSAGTLSSATQTASGTHSITGTVSGTLSPLVSSASGIFDSGFSGGGGASGGEGAEGPLAEEFSGTSDGVLGALIGSASGRLGSLVTLGSIDIADSVRTSVTVTENVN